MFYPLLKSYARLALRIYCSKVLVNRPDILTRPGPLLLAASHPNSFLDGIILTTLFDHQVYSLARGDAFQHPFINRVLRRLRLLPIYRTSEGVHNLEHNYTTFDACQQTFRNKGIVLIFSEGRSENEWHLRPLKKGTARLAITAWQNRIDLPVIPLGINYSSFRSFGKEVHLNFGDIITSEQTDSPASEGRRLVDFNIILQQQLEKLVYEIEPGDDKTRRKIFHMKPDAVFWLLLPAAIAGMILHLPLYLPCKIITQGVFRKSGHYDSVLVSLLMISYPFYLLALALFGIFIHWGLPFTVLVMPLLAMSAVQVKHRGGW